MIQGPRKSTSFQIRSPRKTQVGFADLHMHSTLSDGAHSVQELLEMAHKRGVRCISITDHDNIDSYEIAKPQAEKLGIELVPGVELSAVFEGKDIHILGYFCDVTNLALNIELQEQMKRRQNRVRAIIRKLKTLGVELHYEKIVSYSLGKVLGRPHIAQALIAEEYVRNFSEAFTKYLADGGAAFVEKKGMSPQQAIRLIENAGGIAVMAHPAATDADPLIEEMVEYGLKGIETFSPGQKGSKGRKYRDLAKYFNLIGSGGSDFHNTHSTFGLGGLKMPYSIVDLLKQSREESRAKGF